MPDTVVSLGDFDFAGTEVPERIRFGGAQTLAMQKMPGGARIVDAMGRDDAPLDWSGRFQGAGALDRARYLDGLRIAGKPLTLTWSELSYTVIIRSFWADFEAFYQLPYSISCEIIEDHAAPITTAPTESVDDSVSDDFGGLLDLNDGIGDPTLQVQLGLLGSALAAVPDMFNAGQGALNSLLGPISGALDAAGALIADYEAVAATVTTLGGIVAGNFDQDDVFTQQTVAADQLARLYELRSILNRMIANLISAGASGTIVTVAGATMQSLAAASFDDPNQWTAIARANGSDDPIISGVADVRIPAKRDSAGGVLNRA